MLPRPAATDNGHTKKAPKERGPQPLSRHPTQNTSRSTTQEDIEDFFPENLDVERASRRIRRILFRKREQKIANWPFIRRYLHITFYEPSSMRARIYMGFSTMVVLLFLIVFMIDTFPQYRVRSQWRGVAANVNLATALFFALEWVLRLYSFPRPHRYIFQPLAVVDLLGIIPAFIYYRQSDQNSFGHAKWLRALQVLRVLRVLRLAEYSVEMYVTVRTLRKSLLQITVVMMIIVLFLLTASFLLFYAENDSLDVANVRWLRKNHGVVEPSPFQNVFFCVYWGFVTVTTVGYGDYTPVSPWGQVIACFTMIIGVFTIVFPTSIISNNFASEWKAFHTAQKLREQRILHREYEHKRQDLSRVWQYANQDYEAPPTGGGGDDNLHALSGTQSEVLQIPGASQPSSSEDQQHGQHIPLHLRHKHQRSEQFSGRVIGSTASSDDEDADYMPRSAKMAPFEYNRIMHISEKIEKDLGIPSMALDQADAGNEVNQNLVVNAMYTKLYNDAYGTLCERMLLRLVEQNGLGSIEDVAQFLHSRPSERRLTMLEYKLLNFVYEKASLRAGSAIGTFAAAAAHHTQGDVHSSVMDHKHIQTSTHGHGRGKHRGLGTFPTFDHSSTFSSPNLAGSSKESPSKTMRRRLKSKLSKAYDNLPMTRETTHQSVHSYMSSAIANKTPEALRRSESSRLHLTTGRQSRPRDAGRPVPLHGPVSEELVETPPQEPADSSHDRAGQHAGSTSSPAIAISVLSSSDNDDDGYKV
ncbi:hypothetical protein GGI20_003959 [Coemansia sp. BCRC 34301]|nr:hypothetical protein GGI20_003959 [Coemansia sp. BCRC 34301]